jgi:hypothetical protein
MVLERDRMRDIGRDRERERQDERYRERQREIEAVETERETERDAVLFGLKGGGLNRRERTSLGLLSNFSSFVGHK